MEPAFAFALVVGALGFVLFALNDPERAERFMFGNGDGHGHGGAETRKQNQAHRDGRRA